LDPDFGCCLPVFQLFYRVEGMRLGYFANLAFFKRASAVPGTGGAVEVVLEGAGELGGTGEAGFQSDVGNALSGRGLHEQRGAFEADAADVGVQGLAGDGLEDSMEVEGGEAADFGQGGEGELLVEVLADVVEDAVHAVVIVMGLRRHGENQYSEEGRRELAANERE
jgi:hypothetical protein